MKIKKALYIATFISTVGDGMFYIATAWYVYQKMQASIAVGFLLAFTMIPIILVAPFTGYIADNYNRKKTAILMDILRSLLILFCGLQFVLIKSDISIISIYILTALVKIGDCFFSPCITSLIKINFKNNEYMKIFSVNNTIQQAGTILGSIITGILLSHIEIAYILFFDAFSFMVSAIVIFFMKKDSVVSINKDNCENVIQSFKAGVAYTFKAKEILLLVILCGAPNFVVNLLNTVLCEHTEIALGLGIKEYSLLDASFGIGCACMGALISLLAKRIQEEKMGLVGYTLISIVLFLLSKTRNYYLVILEIVFLGALIMVISINSKTLFAKMINEKYIGRVDSYTYTINSFVVSISGIIAGYLCGIADTLTVFRLYGVICITFIVCQIMLSKNHLLQDEYLEST